MTSGTVSAAAVEVRCNDVLASLAGGGFQATVLLEEGSNVIACVATDGQGQTATATVAVTVDTQPPRVTITAPEDGATVSTPTVTVTGLINDVVVGTVNQQEAQVVCNGVTAQIANRTFLASDVPVASGANTITCVGTDNAGNADSAHVQVTRAASSGLALRLVSGSGQIGAIGTRLSAPLVVELSNGGVPVTNTAVVFRLLRNDGTLHDGARAARSLSVVTDASGRAQVDYTLGTAAGAGNNQVLVAASGGGEVLFSESASPAAPARIVVDVGNNQEGAVDQRLPLPFVAVVIDQGNNRLPGVPVTFDVTQGGGTLGGQQTTTVTTDSDGRAEAVLTLGPAEGPDGNVVVAGFPGNPGPGATFVASGKVPGDPADTRLSGVVLDNTNQPIAGVTLGIEDPTSTTTPRALLRDISSAMSRSPTSPSPFSFVTPPSRALRSTARAGQRRRRSSTAILPCRASRSFAPSRTAACAPRSPSTARC
jgi:Glucodextranase, domain B